MLHSLLGFAGSKAAVLLAAGAITVGAVGVGEATGTLPGIPNEHSRLVSATETATATGTPAGTTLLSLTPTPEGPDGEHGNCNAITRGSDRGRENKAKAPAFQNLDCASTQTGAVTSGTVTPTPTSTTTSRGKSDEEHGNKGAQAPLTATATATATAAAGAQGGPNEHANPNSSR
jgi:hypothetical protein